MPFTKFTDLDFDQIKTSIKDYLRANSNFTDFDFEGSNFSILLDTLAYNTYITAFNANMAVNESFLDSATLRENVVSLARTIGYVPRSRSAAKAEVIITVPTETSSPTLTLNSGVICTGISEEDSYVFSIPESITTTVIQSNSSEDPSIATFGSIDKPVTIYEGILIKKEFVVDTSVNQRFILDNSFVDTSTIVVKVKSINEVGQGVEYFRIDNILNLTGESKSYLIQEIKDEKYEIVFGDGFFGKKLENNSIITVTYIVTNGKEGNGSSRFSFTGSLLTSSGGDSIPSDVVNITTLQQASNGGEIESIDSVKYFAPRVYSSQYRAVTSRDYEAIIQYIYPNTESVSVVGGEELIPPQYGKVVISIKPKNGTLISDFDKKNILSKLKNYSLTGINQEIVDLKILHVEIDSSVYYNTSQVSTAEDLKTRIVNSLNLYASSVNLNTFGGRFKYSKLLQIVDSVDTAITSNITKVIIRRDLTASLNRFAQYELCFGNKFHINSKGLNIKSTGFTISGISDTVYLTDIPNKDANGNLDGSNKGVISIVKETNEVGNYTVVIKSAGTVDYSKGEIILNTINIISTEIANGIVEIQAYPESNDVIGLKDLYLSFSVDKSAINMVRDVISSGDDISGSTFVRDYYTSSYSNGNLVRKRI
jgi:hypothetical protein